MSDDEMVGLAEIITPAVAQAMLANNPTNRPLTQGLVKRYAEEMKQGRWFNNGQGLIFSPEGELLNGQHRLRALIEANVTLPMFVVRGVPRERFETMDTGRARSLGDILGAQNYENPAQLAAMARVTWNYIAGASLSYNPVKSLLLAFVHRYPYLRDVTAKVAACKPPIPNAPLAAVIFLGNAGHQKFDGAIDEFLEGIKTGQNLAKGDPRLTLRDYLFGAGRNARGVVNSEHAFGATARAWNAWAADRELTVIRAARYPNRRTLPIYDFDSDHFSGIEDIPAKVSAIQEANLSRSPNAPQQARPSA